MIFKKISKVQWQHPPNLDDQRRMRFEETMFFMQPDIQNKTKHWYVKYIGDDTVERPWVDQQSAEKYIQSRQALAAKYGGKILSFEIRDID